MKFYIALLVIFFVNAYSAFVPLERAKIVAESYYGHYFPEAASKGSSVINVQENKYEGMITRYTFEFDKGFVIVTADDQLYPILGYSDHGKVPKSDKSGGENFKAWFENYDRQIIYARKTKYRNDESAKLWKDIENNDFSGRKGSVVVDRLVKTQWGMNWPWNERTPKIDGQRTGVSMAAVAMAQIMKYHRWPDKGVGSASYEWHAQTLSADFTTKAWNYDLMPEIADVQFGIYPEYWEDCGWSDDEIAETSLLTYYAALSVNADFNTNSFPGTVVDINIVPSAFVDHWKAQESEIYDFSGTYTIGNDPYFEQIKSELDVGRPWIWHGKDGTLESFMILDGYTSDQYFHFNWCWEGFMDGWYLRRQLIFFYPPHGYAFYVSEEKGIKIVPSQNPYEIWPPTDLIGSISGGDDIVLSWVPNYSAVGYKLYRTKNKQSVPELIAETSEFEYTDNDLPPGEYSYHAVTVYLDGESHNSNSYSTKYRWIKHIR